MIIEWYIPIRFKRQMKYIPMEVRGRVIDIQTRKVLWFNSTTKFEFREAS